ncbi:hypothetical protein [Methanothrix thermoacetophila]|uniref:Uncharacterized protein n=1 Tax=Methanothrix thermoacetophila (strain DSM 6194 / JCM 14653 / NBRC 101360 / PT) TaxID=349307 RepID=A0B6Q0_METTP|nr:hypothetical protein [Methanothrix thermoacetophila]ABK14374.1 hypothetical protein Mthe_0583 [Methanothrix thermoacetophila PT]
MSRLKIMGVLVLTALLAVPAMSMHDGVRGRFDDRGWGPEMRPGGVWLLMDDITQEDLENMTLAEIRELRESKRAELENMTLAEIRALKEKRLAEMENTTLAEMRGKGYTECPYWPMGGAQGLRGVGPCDADICMKGLGGMWLLMDDITQEDLENMTLAEIRELRESKRAELENMTLAEIRELKEKRLAEMENTTLAEMRGKGYTECPYWPMGGAQGPMGGPGYGKMHR